MTSEPSAEPSADAPRAPGGFGTRLSSRVIDAATALSITAAGGFVRFWRLGSPHSIVPLDETYYAPNSYGYLCHGTDMGFNAGAHTCANMAPTFAVHPPVGKELTAIGIKIFGYRPFGWRFAPAVVGTLAILVVYGIARRLWPTKRWPAVAAATLVAVDGLEFVQSRLAMLDIFVMFFILLGIWLLLVDRDRAYGWTGPRWWRIASGLSFGLAVSSKWAAIPLLPVIVAVAFAWEVVRIRGEKDAAVVTSAPVLPPEPPGAVPAPPPSTPEPFWKMRPDEAAQGRGTVLQILRQALEVSATFLIIPALVYLASYTPWFLSTKRYVPPRCNDPVLVHGVQVVVNGEPKTKPKAGMSLWLCDQKEIFDYHRNLKATDASGKPIHPYMSRAWSWPWISRPASHYFTSDCIAKPAPNPCPAALTRDVEILGLPNPAIWWMGFFVALPGCFYLMFRRRDDVAALLIVLFAPLIIPWLVYSRPIFMFYMTPASPLLALMVVHVMQQLKLRWAAVGFVAIAITMFGYFYPVLAAYPLPPNGTFGWNSRIWYGHAIRGDCLSGGVKILCWI